MKAGFLWLSLSVLLLSSGNVTGRPQKRKQESEKAKKEQADDYYRKWLEEDAVYIISKEERQVFLKLTGDDEREHFIEQFWQRRDSNPTTAINEFKEEHYRRITYANENFKSGIPGWVTDRGQIYIKFGPPNQREAFVSGGSYERPLTEGGGTTTTYPWEKWFYRDIPGVGSGIEIEFVDPTLSGEYKIALRKSEKDALFNSEGSGNTIFEDMGVVTRADRLRADIAMRPLGDNDSLFMDVAQTPFRQLERYFLLKQPAAVRFDDLRQVVDSRIFYDKLPYSVSAGSSRINDEASMISLTLSVDPKKLAMNLGSAETPANSLALNIYGRVTGLNWKIASEFDDQVTMVVGGQKPTEGVYQRKFPLQPGRYKLTTVVKDRNNSRIGSQETLLLVPSYKEKLSLSSILLAVEASPGRENDSIADGFMTWSGWKVYPSADNRFSRQKNIYCYFEIYGFQVDQSTSLAHVDLNYLVMKGDAIVLRSPKTFSSTASNYLGDRVAVLAAIPVAGLEPGSYDLDFDVQDQVSGVKRTEKVPFEIF